jgi:hypothetical protein
MTEAQIKAEMRLRALEGLVTTLLAAYCLEKAPSDPVGAFGRMRETVAQTANEWVFAELDPAMSDHYAAELKTALDRLLDIASPQIETMQKVLRGQS